jgi:hypothetical protein
MRFHLPRQFQRRLEIRYGTEALQRFFAVVQLQINSRGLVEPGRGFGERVRAITRRPRAARALPERDPAARLSANIK